MICKVSKKQEIVWLVSIMKGLRTTHVDQLIYLLQIVFCAKVHVQELAF